MEGFAMVFGFILGVGTTVILGSMFHRGGGRDSVPRDPPVTSESDLNDWINDPDFWKRR